MADVCGAVGAVAVGSALALTRVLTAPVLAAVLAVVGLSLTWLAAGLAVRHDERVRR